MEHINNHINATYDEDSASRISDEALLPVYMESPSVRKNITCLEEVLRKNAVGEEVIQSVMRDYVARLIPPGTKGVIRGNKFNQIVRERIQSLPFLQSPLFTVKFEANHERYPMEEIPDWYIYHHPTDTIIIGMNQLDLWSGGQQINRGSKYVLDETKHSNPKCKLLSVICSKTQITSSKNKSYRLFWEGFSKRRLCYLRELPGIIWTVFNL